MKMYKEYDFDDLVKDCWSGAQDTLTAIRENNKVDDFMSYLDSIEADTIPSLGEINDWLWFGKDDILKDLGIDVD